MAMKGMDKLQNELKRLGKRSLNQKQAWRVVGGMVYRRHAVEWFRDALGLRKRSGGPKSYPWRALKSEPYIRRKLKRGKTVKLIGFSSKFHQSYFFKSYNNHALVGIHDYRKAGWLEGMGFEVLYLERDIIAKAENILTNYVWDGKL